jgi:hypothetical protein
VCRAAGPCPSAAPLRGAVRRRHRPSRSAGSDGGPCREVVRMRAKINQPTWLGSPAVGRGTRIQEARAWQQLPCVLALLHGAGWGGARADDDAIRAPDSITETARSPPWEREAWPLVKHELVTAIRLRRAMARARSLNLIAARLVSVATAVLVLATCTTTTPESRSGRVVMSQHNGWTIRISPSFSDRWHARVQVWPPDVNPRTHGGINLHFVESAANESTIVQSAMALARRYVEASGSVHQ